jgi:hypothetical protein
MMHPSTQLAFINDEIGFGVVATAFIPRGTIVWVLDQLDRVFSDEVKHTLPPPFRPVLDRYAYRDAGGNWVLCWDHARFVNHSCEPALLAPGLGFEIALRDIYPGEHITDDYASLNLDEEMPCACGSPQCRRVIRASDFDEFAPEWEDRLRAAWASAGDVDQPLWCVLGGEDRDHAERALRDPSALPSVMMMRYPRPVAVTG